MYRLDNLDRGAAHAASAIGRQTIPALPQATEILIRLLDQLAEWQERAGQRQRLLMLDDRMLADIGADRARAFIEAEKPFWRL